MRKEFEKDLNEFNDSFKEYLRLQLELGKLDLLKKFSRLGAYLFKIVVVMYFSILIAGFLLGSFAVWFGKALGSYFGGVLVAGAALIVAAVLLILLRRKLAVNSIVYNLSRILLEDEEK